MFIMLYVIRGQYFSEHFWTLFVETWFYFNTGITQDIFTGLVFLISQDSAKMLTYLGHKL